MSSICPMARAHAKNRLGRIDALSVPPLGPHGFVPATKKPLADLAWAYFKSRPEWRKVKNNPEYHISANLLKGTKENYRWLGVDWPENRYLLIGLSGDADIKTRKPMQTGAPNAPPAFA
jgi:hypothetical protein